MQKTFIILFLFCTTTTFAQVEGFLYDSTDAQFVNRAGYRGVLALERKRSLKAYCPQPENQGKFPTCVSWAAAYYAWTIRKRFIHQNTVLPAYSPYYVAHYAHRVDKYDKPVSILTVLRQLRQKGTLLQTEDNPDFRKTPKDSLAGWRNRMDSFDFVYDRARPDRMGIVLHIKRQIYLNKPVILGLEIDDSFERLPPNQIWNPAQPHNLKKHAVCVIGYDDDKHAFEIVNSYGRGWGTQGYGWLHYDAVAKYGLQVFVLEK